jgi:hypothetical protein
MRPAGLPLNKVMSFFPNAHGWLQRNHLPAAPQIALTLSSPTRLHELDVAWSFGISHRGGLLVAA